mmetsp:Transcript_83837/g.211440  ORF Transcript_83837/g.211440 Transcript_83837/m.211440 type:complete len:148 (+) Transcript_83837:976-1419(+)
MSSSASQNFTDEAIARSLPPPPSRSDASGVAAVLAEGCTSEAAEDTEQLVVTGERGAWTKVGTVFRRESPGEVEQRARDLSDNALPRDGLRDMLPLPDRASTELVGATLLVRPPEEPEAVVGLPDVQGDRRTLRSGEPGEAVVDMAR